MKKKLAAIVLTTAMIMGSIAGCSSKKAEPEAPQTVEETPAEEETEEAAGAEADAGTDSGEKLVVGFSNWSRSFEFYVSIEEGLQKIADEKGIELITQDPDGYLTKQTQQLENFITRKVDGIIIVPIDSEASGDEVKMVNEAGIPIITLDIAALGGGETLSHIESNNYMGGEKSAEYIAEQIGGKGKVAVIDNPTITSLIARTDGFKDTMEEKYPDIEIVSIQSGDSQREKGMEVAENILQKNPDLDAFYCTNDMMGLGALQAVQAKGLDTIIIGFGAEKEALTEIKNDTNYKASFSQEPVSMGETGMSIMAQILNGEEVEDFIAVDVGLITIDNVDEYLK